MLPDLLYQLREVPDVFPCTFSPLPLFFLSYVYPSQHQYFYDPFVGPIASNLLAVLFVHLFFSSLCGNFNPFGHLQVIEIHPSIESLLIFSFSPPPTHFFPFFSFFFGNEFKRNNSFQLVQLFPLFLVVE